MNPKERNKPIISEILAAFSGVPYPGDENIVDHACLECDRVAEYFKGKHWKELPSNDFLKSAVLAAGIHLLTAEAFRFYLPFFLTFNLELLGSEEALSAESSDLRATVTFALCPPVLEENKRFGGEKWTPAQWELALMTWKRRMQGFNSLQKNVIASFLKIVREGVCLESEKKRIDGALEFFSVSGDVAKPDGPERGISE